MPITNGSDNSQLNGDLASSFYLRSLEDDESFVVLERSTANDDATQQAHSYQTLSNNCSFPVFNNMAGSAGVTANQTSIYSQAVQSLGVPYDTTNMSISAEEIDKRLQEVLHENVNLKENLYQTNLAMKQQLSTVKLLQDRASEVQKNHQSKFEETKALILKLGSEKNELQEANNLLNGELTKILSENATLKKDLSTALGNLQILAENERKSSQCQPTSKETELRELVDQLTKKLEAVERARRQQEFDIDKLNAQVGRLNQELIASQEKSTQRLQETREKLFKSEAALQATQDKLTSSENALSASQAKLISLQASQEKFKSNDINLPASLENLSENESAIQTVQKPSVSSHPGFSAPHENTSQNYTLRQDDNSTTTMESSQHNSLQNKDKMLKYYGLLNHLEASVQEVETSLSSWYTPIDPLVDIHGDNQQLEISELRRLLMQEQSQSVARKKNLCDAVSAIHALLDDFLNLGKELERVKADHALKESHGFAYDELMKKNFTERLDSLTAKLVQKEEALAISERHLASLEEAVRLQNDEKKESEEVKVLKQQIKVLTHEVATKDEQLTANQELISSNEKKLQEHQKTGDASAVLERVSEEVKNLKRQVEALTNEVLHKDEQLKTKGETIVVLELQAKTFEDDFEAERKSRESLAAEKERALDDLRHLQKRNQELIDEINRIRNAGVDQAPPAAAAGSSNPRTQERTSPPRTNQNLAVGNNGTIFHEKQEGYLCAQHCLNALLQGPHFNAVDLAELAQEMDYAEKVKFAEAGVDSKEYQSFLAKPSENVDDTGYFSVQVISCALALWGLEMVPYKSSEPRAEAARNNPATIKAFICNSHSHWFTIRHLGNQWFNLDSTLSEPKPLTDLYLHLFLDQFQEEGNSVFVIFGDFPPCLADKEPLLNRNEDHKSQSEEVDSIHKQAQFPSCIKMGSTKGNWRQELIKSLQYNLNQQNIFSFPASSEQIRHYLPLLRLYKWLVLNN